MRLIQLNLAKLKGFTIRDLKGRNGPIRCAIIPLGLNPWIYVPEDGKYAIVDMVEMELKEPDRYGHCSMLKANPKKSVVEQMSDEDRYRLPILGNVRILASGGTGRGYRPAQERDEVKQAGSMPSGISSVLSDDDDLPF